jgi:phosphonopyruvate decarboxylase
VIAADSFLVPARRRGIDFYTGVPCSFLTPIINRVISDPRLEYVAAASEGEAVAIAAGAWLAGRRTAVMCQNSGLGNAVNPLTSLNHPFRIPTLLIVTWRGEPGLKDEPQHALMGPITPTLLDTIQVPHRPFPEAEDEVEARLAEAAETMEATGLPFALVMRKGSVAEEGLDAAPMPVRRPGSLHDMRAGTALPTRIAVLERMLATLPDSAAVIATTGKAGRELFTLADRPQHLYQVGSMGCAGAMGLGTALAVGRPVVVVDGDGAALMKLGTFATIGTYAPPNLVHLVLDNGTYDSTGGQMTVSASVDFAQVAAACGYANGFSCDDLGGFADVLQRALAGNGPHLIHMRIAPGSMAKLGRPAIPPPEVARRFRAFLAGTGV